jgi:AcrR family transcriptional regulator
MVKKALTTEEKILEAAKKVFHRKGFEGARMQEIADEAGINKALLHYYFRTKENLFDDVFKAAFREIFPNYL